MIMINKINTYKDLINIVLTKYDHILTEESNRYLNHDLRLGSSPVDFTTLTQKSEAWTHCLQIYLRF